MSSALNILSPIPAEVTGTLAITEGGAQGVRKFLATNDAPPGAVLRIGVRGGGCSGLSYVVEVDAEAAREGDHVIEAHGVTVRVDRKSMRVLQGVTLDYKVGLLDAGEQDLRLRRELRALNQSQSAWPKSPPAPSVAR